MVEAGHELVEFGLVDVGEASLATGWAEVLCGRVLHVEEVVHDRPDVRVALAVVARPDVEDDDDAVDLAPSARQSLSDSGACVEKASR